MRLLLVALVVAACLGTCTHAAAVTSYDEWEATDALSAGDGTCLPGCAADNTTCKHGSCFPSQNCLKYVSCSHIRSPDFSDWRQNSHHSCVCKPGWVGTDCSLVRDDGDARHNGKKSWCPDGQYYNGLPYPNANKPNHLECFIDTSLALLSLRLHRVNVTILPATVNSSSDASMIWSLQSRHYNYSVPGHSKYHHKCDNQTVDMSCKLTQCKVTGSASCGTLLYMCYHAHCYSQTGGFINLYVEKLNQPDSWPVKLEFDSINGTTGGSILTLYTGSLNFVQHCTAGYCDKDPPACSPPALHPPLDSKLSYIVLGAFGVAVVGISVGAVACAFLAARPSKRSKPPPKRTSFDGTFVEFDDVVAQQPPPMKRSASATAASPLVSPMPSAPAMGVVFKNITYDVPIRDTRPLCSRLKGACKRSTRPSKRVLHGISGAIKPQELVALMGPSGAGKSSLLDILASHDKSGVVKGCVEYHWQSHRVTARSDAKLNKSHTGVAGVGYVYQDDRLLPTETVRETLLFSARIRLPRHLSEYSIRHRVEEVIQQLELQHVADSYIGSPDAGGGISGGERKRVAIGVELLANPRLLLLDEPTTGLDSHSVTVVMKVLRETARAGCACVLSIHQPTSSAFRAFDKVLLLTTGGRLAFCGPPMAAASHFVDKLHLRAPRIRASTGGSTIVKFLPPVDADGNLIGVSLPATPQPLSRAPSHSRASYGSLGVAAVPPASPADASRDPSSAAAEHGGEATAAAATNTEDPVPPAPTHAAAAGAASSDDPQHTPARLQLPAPTARRVRRVGAGAGAAAGGGGVVEAKAAGNGRMRLRVLDSESDTSDDESLMVNPAEMLLDAAGAADGAEADRLAEVYSLSDMGRAVTAHIQAVQHDTTLLADEALKPPSQGVRAWLDSVDMFALLCLRGFRQMRRDPSLLLTQTVLTLTVAVVIGLLFLDLKEDLNGVHNRTGVLFFNVVFFCLSSMSSIGVLILEKHTFFRERARGFYTTAPYFLSKVVVDLLPLRILPPLLYGCVTYYMIKLNDDPTRFAMFLIGLCLVNTVAATACYLISALCDSLSKANLIASLFFVFNVLFGGVLLTARNKAINTLMYFAVFNYAFQYFMMNEFYHMKGTINFNPVGSGAVPIPGEEWLVNWGIDGDMHPNLADTNMGILATWAICMLVAAFLLLAFFQRYVK